MITTTCITIAIHIASVITVCSAIISAIVATTSAIGTSPPPLLSRVRSAITPISGHRSSNRMIGVVTVVYAAMLARGYGLYSLPPIPKQQKP